MIAQLLRRKFWIGASCHQRCWPLLYKRCLNLMTCWFFSACKDDQVIFPQHLENVRMSSKNKLDSWFSNSGIGAVEPQVDLSSVNNKNTSPFRATLMSSWNKKRMFVKMFPLVHLKYGPLAVISILSQAHIVLMYLVDKIGNFGAEKFSPNLIMMHMCSCWLSQQLQKPSKFKRLILLISMGWKQKPTMDGRSQKGRMAACQKWLQ